MSINNNNNTETNLKLNLYVAGKPITIGDISAIDIYESLEFPGITGSITWKDSDSVIETSSTNPDGKKTQIGDLVRIEFSSFGRESDEYILEYRIDEIGQAPVPNSTETLATISFSSTWSKDLFTVTDTYFTKNNDTIDEVIKDIIKKYCKNVEFGVWKKTKQKVERFISPHWTPIQMIKYFMNYSIHKDDSKQGLETAGYVLWTSLRQNTPGVDVVNFAPVSYFYEESEMYAKEMDMKPEDTMDVNRMLNLYLGRETETVKMANLGLGHTKFIGFDYDRTEFKETDKTVTDYSHPHLADVSPIPKEILDKDFNPKVRYQHIYPQRDYWITKEVDYTDFLYGKLYNKYSLSFCDLITVNFKANGVSAAGRDVGNRIKIKFPSSKGIGDTHNSTYSGEYIIRNVRHHMSRGGKQYYQFITCMSDSYHLTRKDKSDDGSFSFTEWSNQ